MKNLIFILALAVLAACSTPPADKYNPDKNLSAKELDANLWSIIRYLGRSPEGLTPPERFYPAYDSHYMEQKKLVRVDAWYKKNDTHYFLVSRIAPSVTEKRVATAGKVVFDDKGGIAEYEEVFRTWKLVPDTLKKRSLFLFDKMVQGENLTPFETRYSNGVEYIEFPDERTYFDKVERSWKVRE
jgi:hypothetical protein